MNHLGTLTVALCLTMALPASAQMRPIRPLPPPHLRPIEAPTSETVPAQGFASYSSTTPPPSALDQQQQPRVVETRNTETLETIKSLEVPELRPNAITFELLGRGGLYSFNYDRSLWGPLALGAGISYYGWSSGNMGNAEVSASALIIPVYGNYYFSMAHHRPFLSAGLDFINGQLKLGGLINEGTSRTETLFTFSGGYEYRGPKGFVFRAAPYLVTGFVTFVWFGAGLGYAF